MKPLVPRPDRKALSRTAARNAALVNQLATPGLGSLMARRWIAGIGQLLLALAGFVLVVVWFFETMARVYDEINGDAAPHSVAGTGELGAWLFVMAWFWALLTSISLMARAKSEEPTVPQADPLSDVHPPAVPPKLS